MGSSHANLAPNTQNRLIGAMSNIHLNKFTGPLYDTNINLLTSTNWRGVQFCLNNLIVFYYAPPKEAGDFDSFFAVKSIISQDAE